MSALRDFESVGYRLEGDPNAPALVWLPQEKRWGPGYLKLDLGMYASEGGDVTFAIYGKYDRTWLNSSGLESRTEIQLGGENLISTSLMQPLDTAHRWFVEPRVFWSRSLEDVFRDGERLARYQFQDTAAQLDFGVNIADVAQARLGYLYDRRSVDVDIGVQLLPEGDAEDAGITALFEYDTRDTAFSPTRGLAVAAEYMRSDDSLGADRDWERAELGVGVALPLRRDVLWLSLAGGSDLGSDLPADRKFPLGGPGSFPGLHSSSVLVPPVRSHPSPPPTPVYIRKFQPVSAPRGKNTHPDRSPAATPLDTGAAALSDAVGRAQNSIANGLAAGGLSVGWNGTMVLVPPAPL